MPSRVARTPGRDDRGAAALEYAAVFVLVAGLAGAVLYAVPSFAGSISDGISRSICLAFGDLPVECASRTEAADAPDSGSGGGQDSGLGGGPPDALGDELPVIGDGRAPGEYRVGSFNMAGGNSSNYDAEEAAPAIISSIENRQPAVMTVQEACDQAIDEIDNHFDEYSTVFNPVEVYDPSQGDYSGGKCKDSGGDFGTALIVHEDLEFDTANDPHILTPEDGEFAALERRQMVCVTSETHRLAACTAHLTKGAPNEDDDNYDEEEADLLDRSRRAEAEEIQRVLSQEYGDYTVILGGDLNAGPGSAEASHLYHEDYGGGAQGELIDASGECGGDLAGGGDCRDGEGTHSNGKIDYLFVSDDVEVLGSEIGSANHSDHDLVWSDIHLDAER